MAGKATAPAPGLTDEDVLRRAHRYEQAKRIEGRVKKIAAACSEEICAELQLRKVTALDGEDTSVTMVIGVQLDEQALFNAASPQLRKELFAPRVNLNALPAPVIERILEQLAGLGCSKLDIAKATEQVLDREAYERARAAKRIKAPVLRVCEKRKAPYIKVSHGGPKARRSTKK